MRLYPMAFTICPCSGQASGGNQINEIIRFVQVFTSCGPEKERCVQTQIVQDESCWIPCAGLYADVWDDSTKQTLQNVMKGRM